jgi:hypothetical protein
VAAIVMMAAWVAFAVQGMFVAASEAATGDSSHYYLGFVFGHSHGEGHSHVVTHSHAGGIVHQHAIDDDDDALDKHVKEPGWNMAVVVCVLPSRDISAIFEVAGRKLAIENPDHLRVADSGGLRRPPRPPYIA